MAWRLITGVTTALCLAGAPASACSGRLESVSKSPSNEYDPFSPLEPHDHYSVTVRNTGTEACAYSIGFVPNGSNKLGGVLPYTIQSLEGRDLLPSTSRHRGGTPLSAPVDVGATLVVPFFLKVPRGHFATPGNYSDEVKLVLFASSHRRVEPHIIDERPFAVVRTVSPQFGVNVAGANTTTTVDFGTLTEGEERFVILHTRANQPYKLQLASENGGRLALDPPVAGSEWTIEYDLRVDNIVVSLAPGVSIPESLSPNGYCTHKLAFRVRDTAKKRAGLYRDTLVVKIGPKM